MSARQVAIAPVRLWRIRLTREGPRYLLLGAAAWGLLASARYALAPPRPLVRRDAVQRLPDQAAESFAVQFARRYLTWRAAQPEAYARSLLAFTGEGAAEDDGVELPASGSMEARSVEVAQERAGPAGERVYTLACVTDAEGTIYLTVGVLRERSGALAIAGYPAFVGPPASVAAQYPSEGFADVSDASLQTVVERSLRNYLEGNAGELAADLTAGARVSLPAAALSLGSIQQLRWLPGGGSVVAVADASDELGTRYTLEYELDVMRVAGRWEVSAIQTDPDS